MWVGGKCHVAAALSQGIDPVPFLQEAGWASEPVWTAYKSLASTRV
jgi:hypothetical protein